MKKYYLLFVLAFAASAMHAQNGELYSLLFRDRVESDIYLDCAGNVGLMQQHNGDLVTNTFIYEDNGNYTYTPLGSLFYKISPSTHTIIDSLFVTDTTRCGCIVRDPRGEGNIQAYFEYHDDCDSTFLRISHFPDNDLNTNPEEDIVVPLCEGFTYGGAIVDSKGDLILQYIKEIDVLHYDEYAARFDLDGTLKYQTLLYENEVWGLGGGQLREFKESPLNYYQWGNTETYNGPYRNMVVYVIDSLFNKNPVIINSILSEEAIDPFYSTFECLNIDGDTEVIPVGGDDVLVASKYVNTIMPYQSQIDDEYGVVVAKYDIRTMQKKSYIVFNDYPGGYSNQAACMGLKMMTDGTVYFVYKEQGYPAESVVIVKMDTDLNVEWKRFCKTDNIILSSPLEFPILIEDEQGEEQGIVWAGIGLDANNDHYGLLCFFLNHDGPVNDVNESGIEVRPYAFFPNPTKGQLHIQFSPDVQPAQVELYDLQGRLVRMQNKAFESIDLSQLPAGTYTMRVILEDGQCYSDKVVKE